MSKQAKSAPSETTYEWECSQCGADNRVTDAPMICAQCSKQRTDERCLHHFKLTPVPVKYGYEHRGPVKGYTQRGTHELHAAIVNEVRALLEQGRSERDAKRIVAKRRARHIKTVRKVWREFKEARHPEDAVKN